MILFVTLVETDGLTSSITEMKSKPQWDIASCIKMTISKIQVLKMLNKGNLCALLVGMQIGAATMGNNKESPQKTKNLTNIWCSN